MLFKQLGQTGLNLPEIGLGTWDYHAGPGPLRRGLEAGALFIDTAESYGTESVVGAAVAEMRGRVFIATKVSREHFRATELRTAVDSSLRQLRIERIDLLQLHNPNPAVPITETMGTLSGLVDDGKIRFIGVSNFSVAQLREAQNALGRYPIVSNQVRYSVVDRTIEKDGLLEYCQSHGVTVIAYCPLARGLQRIHDCDPSDVIGRIAKDLGKSPAQVALNWCLCRDGVVAIPKGNSEAHILDNCGASDWRLGEEDLRTIDAQLKYRHRNSFDALVRRSLPDGLQKVAGRALKYMPPGLRRRFR